MKYADILASGGTFGGPAAADSGMAACAK